MWFLFCHLILTLRRIEKHTWYQVKLELNTLPRIFIHVVVNLTQWCSQSSASWCSRGKDSASCLYRRSQLILHQRMLPRNTECVVAFFFVACPRLVSCKCKSQATTRINVKASVDAGCRCWSDRRRSWLMASQSLLHFSCLKQHTKRTKHKNLYLVERNP